LQSPIERGTLSPVDAKGEPLRSYLSVLERAAPTTVRVLQAELGLSRRAAAELYGAVSAIVPAGLARHTRRRPSEPWSAVEVVRKYGRPADLEAPELGIRGRLDGRPTSARLGGLLGDAGPRLVTWLSARGSFPEEDTARALTAVAPLVLGALGQAMPSRTLAGWIAMRSDAVLDAPDALLAANGALPEIFRRLSRLGQPWPVRVLGIEG
jgi:hypothetical protein